jgi:glycosyltransferase involved in cell wall biosynthesis
VTDRPLVVLQLVTNRWWTGSADPALSLARGLRELGHRVLLGLTRGGPFEERARAAGFAPVEGLSLDPGLAPRAALRDALRLRRLIRAEGVDVVHAHHSHDHWLARLTRGRALLARSFHNRRSVSGGRAARGLYRATEAALAVTGEVAERCRAVGIPDARVTLVDGVADVARFLHVTGGPAIRKELGLGAAPVAGCVARLGPGRGHELLLDGWALVLARRPEARLVLVGKGERRAELGARVRALGMEHAVAFAGYRGDDLPEALGAMDVFVLLGAGSDESCRAAIEAMAAARPVVAQRVGALGDTVVHGVTGLVVERAEAGAVADALLSLLGDRERARAMGQAGRERALERFTPARHAAQVLAAYRRALKGRR